MSYGYSLFLVVKLYRIINSRSPKTQLISKRSIQKKKWFKIFLEFIATFLMPLAALRLVYFHIRDFSNQHKQRSEFFRTRIDASSNSFLIFAPIDWEYRKQRSQNMALSLHKIGKDVFYINPTIMYHSKKDIEFRIKKIDGINVVNFFSNYHRRSYYIGIKPVPKEIAAAFAGAIESMLALYSNVSTVIMIQQPGWFPVVSHLLGNQVIFDCMDLHNGFEAIADDIDYLEQEIDLAFRI